MDLALTSAGGTMAPTGPELSERDRQYLSALPQQIRLLPRMRPDIEQRLVQLSIIAQRDGLLVLRAKGRSLLRQISFTGTQPMLAALA
jgi:hypothetical protein